MIPESLVGIVVRVSVPPEAQTAQGWPGLTGTASPRLMLVRDTVVDERFSGGMWRRRRGGGGRLGGGWCTGGGTRVFPPVARQREGRGLAHVGRSRRRGRRHQR